jgi:hypothetical protein
MTGAQEQPQMGGWSVRAVATFETSEEDIRDSKEARRRLLGIEEA